MRVTYLRPRNDQVISKGLSAGASNTKIADRAAAAEAAEATAEAHGGTTASSPVTTTGFPAPIMKSPKMPQVYLNDAHHPGRNTGHQPAQKPRGQ